MNIRLSLLVVSALALGAWDFGVAQGKREPGASKILALESKWNEAYKRGDIATMESLLADDFVITVEDGVPSVNLDTSRTMETLPCTWKFRK